MSAGLDVVGADELVLAQELQRLAAQPHDVGLLAGQVLAVRQVLDPASRASNSSSATPFHAMATRFLMTLATFCPVLGLSATVPDRNSSAALVHPPASHTDWRSQSTAPASRSKVHAL
jgi:hypothetical protein